MIIYYASYGIKDKWWPSKQKLRKFIKVSLKKKKEKEGKEKKIPRQVRHKFKVKLCHLAIWPQTSFLTNLSLSSLSHMCLYLIE